MFRGLPVCTVCVQSASGRAASSLFVYLVTCCCCFCAQRVVLWSVNHWHQERVSISSLCILAPYTMQLSGYRMNGKYSHTS